jgi:hypothetical protein
MTHRAFALLWSAAIVLTPVLSGCATPSPGPSTLAAQEQPGAFSASPLGADRYRLELVGRPQEARETVQGELLRRAAELAAREGYDWFETADQQARVQPRFIAGSNPVTPIGATGPSQGFLPRSWRDAGPRWGGDWRNWDPFWGEPTFENRPQVRRVDLVVASAEIRLHRGVRPAGLAQAYDALPPSAPKRAMKP